MFFYSKILTLDPYFSNVSLLLRGASTTGSIPKDDSVNNHAISKFGDASINTTTFKYGGSSLAFDGNGDYLSIAPSNTFAFGTGDFTIEAWVYIENLPSLYYSLYDGLNWPTDSTARNNTFVVLIDSTGKLTVYSQSAFRLTSSGSIPTNSWSHIALVRTGTTLQYYINGALDSVTDTLNTDCTSQTLTIGIAAESPNDPNYTFKGYIDDYRITKGVARYTANFTPPTSELPNN